MMRDRLQPWLDWLKRVITQPRSELTRWQRAARYAYDLGRYGAHQLREDKAPQMAGALAFRTLFGLLPVVVVSTVVVRALFGFEWLMERLAVLFTKLGLDHYHVLGASEREAVTGGESQTLSAWLLELVSQAEALNFAAVGWVGVAVLIYSAIGLMVTIENSFNTIFRTAAGRSWMWRALMYWFVLSLGPILILLTAYLSSKWTATLQALPVWTGLAQAAPAITWFLVTWLLLLFVYWLVPSTTVSFRSALIGALVTTVLVEVLRRSLGAYLDNLLSIRILYGSLGLIPVFMFWVYVMWLVVLFGLEVAATLQMLRGRRLEELERKNRPTGVVEPATVLLVMEVVVEHFGAGRAVSAQAIAEESGMPQSTVVRMLDGLVEAGFLHRLEGEAHRVALARSPARIAADEVMAVGYRLVETGGGGRRSELIARLRQAQTSVAAELRLG